MTSSATDDAVQVATPRRRRAPLLLGPAFVAAIAYVDPGNVAANLTAGARYGYLLLWVLVVANAMAVLVQYQSAKLGLVTGDSLPEHPAAGVLGAGRGGRGGHLGLHPERQPRGATHPLPEHPGQRVARDQAQLRGLVLDAVSYTHLTLPTICSV